MLFSRYRDAEAHGQMAAAKAPAPLVQIEAMAARPTLQGAEIAAKEQVA